MILCYALVIVSFPLVGNPSVIKERFRTSRNDGTHTFRINNFLATFGFNQPKVEEASAVLIMIADPRGVEENLEKVLDSWQELRYIKPDIRQTYAEMAKNLYGAEDSLKRKLFAVKNTALFSTTLMIAAKGLGLATHPIDGFDEECIKREFDIPGDKIIPMIIAIGYLRSGITLLLRAFRRGVNEFVRFEKY